MKKIFFWKSSQKSLNIWEQKNSLELQRLKQRELKPKEITNIKKTTQDYLEKIQNKQEYNGFMEWFKVPFDKTDNILEKFNLL